MQRKLLAAAILTLFVQLPAHAISAKYREQLERSGCTQVSEAQGCDLTKTKAENAKAGFGEAPAAASPATTGSSPYAGQWIAKSKEGATVATIRIDAKEHVWVNGKQVKAKRSDGALQFTQGTITYRVQGDRSIQDQDLWHDSDAGTQGPISLE